MNLCPWIALAAAAAPVLLLGEAAAPPKLEGISQAAIQNAFQILRSEYIRSGDLNFDELNRAALQGLLERLDLGAGLIRKIEAQRPDIATGVIADRLTADIAFLRPQSFAPEEATQLLSKMREFAEAKVPHLILDLRSPAAAGDFEIAASMLEAFVPEGEVMFKLKQVGREGAQLFISHATPVWTSPLLVLVDEETNNLGETLAAVLQQRKQAIILGTRTRGATVRYETRPLDDVWLMRYARAEMLLPDDRSLFEKGITPDFLLDLPSSTKSELFSQEKRPALKQTIFDHSRPRYNEAALVARKNPELEEYIRRSTGGPANVADSNTQAHDTVLQRAVDILIARMHLDSVDLHWETRPGEEPATVRKATRAP
ncbi:MAG: S41 family peptidase [Verrucomicrobiota bacterium]